MSQAGTDQDKTVRTYVLLAVDVSTAQWRKEHGDEGEPLERVLDDVHYAIDQTDFAANRSWVQTVGRVTELPQDEVRPRDRTDEAGFRRAVPRRVGGLEIMAVHGYRAGSAEDGRYAGAVALTYSGEGHVQPWATHLIYHQDDRDDPQYEWIAHAGHYCNSEEQARDDLLKRTP